MSHQNGIRQALESGEFLYTLEHVPALQSEGPGALLALVRNAELVGRDPRIRGLNIGDRVKGRDCVDTVECGRIVLEASGKIPLLHLAGKGRDPAQANAVYRRALDAGLTNMLLVSGDRLPDEARPDRVRYHDSVVAVSDVRQMEPGTLIAAAVSPFKYREEELANQYLKMAKKINAGASYLITNCGWDMRKFEELAWYCNARGFTTPLVANLLLPSMGWARGIHGRRLPGVHMSDDLFNKISEEHALGKPLAQQHYFHRLALQVIGVKLMGYAGVQLSGVDEYETLCRVIELVDDLEKTVRSRLEWNDAWRDAHRLQDGREVIFSPLGGIYLFGTTRPAPGSLDALPRIGDAQPGEEEMRQYRKMSTVHDLAFKKGSTGAAVMKPLMRVMGASKLGHGITLKLEHSIKAPLLGCESCGFCRIEYLMYKCPETCPKGLANGPCSGTDDNVCEFKDRECIHNGKYRIAKALGKLAELEEVLVPAVQGTRNTSSWINEFSGAVPLVRRVRTTAAKTNATSSATPVTTDATSTPPMAKAIEGVGLVHTTTDPSIRAVQRIRNSG
jgi:methylenetetrahydrofolate reductase (NADPH)